MMLLELDRMVLTPAEERRLDAGEVVVRSVAGAAPEAVAVFAAVDVAATREETWTALTDFEARRGQGAVRDLAEYRPASEGERWLRWTVGFSAFEVVYHNHYVFDPAGGRFAFSLDAGRPNDLTTNAGAFELVASPEGTRVLHLAESSFGAAVPSLVRAWMVGEGIRGFLAGIARRAAAG
jgi:hypothetical protein